MTTMVGTQTEYVDALTALLELELNALEAYKAAVNRLENILYKDPMIKYQADHERHIDNLKTILMNYKMDVPQQPTLKSILTQGKVVIGGLMGDQSILKAMLSNEMDTNTAYERVNKYQNIPFDEKKILEDYYEDEKKHKAWLESVIQ